MAGACHCQLSSVAAATMVVLVFAAAVATLTSLITAQETPTPGRNCYRKCVEGDSRVCHFDFDVQPYQTMSRACYGCPFNVTDCSRPHCIGADGVTRRVLVVNKQMPGPPIQVCQGDTVVVNVKNSLSSEGLTIHWHGLTMEGRGSSSSGTPHMDGTPGVTQCPIPAGSTFKYKFVASDVGTHFYHAHTGFHRGDGVFGSLIVRQPPAKDPNYDTFDYDLPEHVMLFHDWLHIPTEDKFLFRHHSGGDDFPESMLVNGLGPHQFAMPGSAPALMPYAKFKVAPGNSYRLRLINTAILNCPITVTVADHLLTVIASDGKPLVPVNTSSLVVYPGERWDVVLQADLEKSGFFWISFVGLVDCMETQAHQYALLEYEDLAGPQQTRGSARWRGSRQGQLQQPQKPAGAVSPLHTEVEQINTVNSACSPTKQCVADMRSPDPMPAEARTPSANITLYLAFEMRRTHNPHFYSRSYYNFDLMSDEQRIPTPQINNLSFVHPATPLLLGGGAGETACTAESPPLGRSCHEDYCECLHLYRIPLGATVDLVLIDEGQYGDENHPIHLHGQYFWVLAQGRPNDVPDAAITRDEVIALDHQGRITRNLVNPPYKDTVTIPDGGYSVVRFRATNPGYWLLHCHLLFHSAAGMNLVFKIGEDQDIPAPPAGFPTCGNYRGSEL
ncbi:uncharacterized protein LOC126985218 [Eriocheir sinensis]|uniref:uncharacterized protein LOC126985218 n=1 Tax=Eriocheir sinensis TaxID=95602 RepID=UPI0021CA0031|nr:uncharacterized protein LOC126985218 [Eriocheir sinensis]XP_050695783.1 uncharacterized protein LOC126985218 [Eriocheir sinensis]XP_050695784.1 uncharacterized protein LOC126985218 [Eriocheir sinensis]